MSKYNEPKHISRDGVRLTRVITNFGGRMAEPAKKGGTAANVAITTRDNPSKFTYKTPRTKAYFLGKGAGDHHAEEQIIHYIRDQLKNDRTIGMHNKITGIAITIEKAPCEDHCMPELNEFATRIYEGKYNHIDKNTKITAYCHEPYDDKTSTEHQAKKGDRRVEAHSPIYEFDGKKIKHNKAVTPTDFVGEWFYGKQFQLACENWERANKEGFLCLKNAYKDRKGIYSATGWMRSFTNNQRELNGAQVMAAPIWKCGHPVVIKDNNNEYHIKPSPAILFTSVNFRHKTDQRAHSP